MVKKMIPSMLTLGNLLLGFTAILMTFNDRMKIAILLIIAGLICDFFDGFCARKLHVESAMGKELDSLADLVTFGVAPAILVHIFSLNQIPVFGIICCLVYVSCSALRLARFNAEQSHISGFIGMPTPLAALLVLLLAVTLKPLAVAVGTLLIGLLMVSHFSFPSLKKVEPEVVEDC